MKTHKVIDVLSHKENDFVYVGTYSECREWRFEQGFGYRIEEMTDDEKLIHNN